MLYVNIYEQHNAALLVWKMLHFENVLLTTERAFFPLLMLLRKDTLERFQNPCKVHLGFGLKNMQ